MIPIKQYLLSSIGKKSGNGLHRLIFMCVLIEHIYGTFCYMPGMTAQHLMNIPFGKP